MAPHSEGEERSYAHAFEVISRGFGTLNREAVVDENAKQWIQTIERLMDTTGVIDDSGRGTYWQRAKQLTIEERRAFSKAVDELAHWFAREDR